MHSSRNRNKLWNRFIYSNNERNWRNITLPYTGQIEFKVIADHIRTLTFALADGAVFENVGRGYVLRRLLRRASRMGRKLNINREFLSDLIDIVVENTKKYIHI